MKIVSINQIIELNELLKKKNLSFKIHIRDACGGQSFYIEPFEDLDTKSINEDLYETLEQYFSKQRMTLVYADDKINFTIK